MFSGKIKGIVDFTGLPEMMKQYSQLPGDTDHYPLFSVLWPVHQDRLSSSFSKIQTPATQVTVRAEEFKDVVSSIYKELAKVGIASLSDAELWILIAVAPHLLQAIEIIEPELEDEELKRIAGIALEKARTGITPE